MKEQEEPGKVRDSISEIEDLKGGETILLVEDNEQVRNTAYDILNLQGYKVLQCSGGEEAIKTMTSTNQPVHLLLTDVVMPDMNGKQLYKKLSKNIHTLKVLYMSGYTDDIIVHHGVLDNNVHLLQKPFTNHSILRKVREVTECVNENETYFLLN